MEAVAEQVAADIEVPQYPARGQPDWDVRLVDVFSELAATLRDQPSMAPLVHRRLMKCIPGLALGQLVASGERVLRGQDAGEALGEQVPPGVAGPQGAGVGDGRRGE